MRITHTFRNMTVLTPVLQLLLGLMVIRSVAEAFIWGNAWRLMDANPLPMERVKAQMELAKTLAMVGNGLYAVFAAMFLWWVFRANQRARKLGCQGFGFSAKLASLGFLIPFFNYWVAYKGMRDLRQASQYGDAYDDRMPPSVWVWYLLLLIAHVAMLGEPFFLPAYEITPSVGEMQEDIVILVILLMIKLPCYIATMVLAWKIHRWQQKLARPDFARAPQA